MSNLGLKSSIKRRMSELMPKFGEIGPLVLKELIQRAPNCHQIILHPLDTPNHSESGVSSRGATIFTHVHKVVGPGRGEHSVYAGEVDQEAVEWHEALQVEVISLKRNR